MIRIKMILSSQMLSWICVNMLILNAAFILKLPGQKRVALIFWTLTLGLPDYSWTQLPPNLQLRAATVFTADTLPISIRSVTHNCFLRLYAPRSPEICRYNHCVNNNNNTGTPQQQQQQQRGQRAWTTHPAAWIHTLHVSVYVQVSFSVH